MSTLPPAKTTDAGGDDDDVQEIAFAKRGCICFCMPRLRSEASQSWWERVRSPENKERWWARGWKKVREWSEIVAGPKWKTFIRRFNNNRSRAVHYARHGSFHYDPLSYALNFDDGNAAGGNGGEDDGYGYGYAGFSSRFASVPATVKSSMDLGKDAPAFT